LPIGLQQMRETKRMLLKIRGMIVEKWAGYEQCQEKEGRDK